MVKTMEWQHDALEILDQTKLPVEISFIKCTTYLRVAEAIKRLEVRGAPAIGAAAGFAMVLGWQQLMREGKANLQAFAAVRDELTASRPTAVNLAWAANKLYARADELAGQGKTPDEIAVQLEMLAIKIYDDDIACNKKMGEYGAELLPLHTRILTHCNAGALATCGWGTALGVIRAAHAQGKIDMVYADETRPLLQGARLTVWELMQDNIPVTVITDNMAAWTMKQKGINAVVTGADRIALNGDTANKIGTYGVALAAKHHGIPFYIAAPVSTFDFYIATGADIPIEERSADEVKQLQGVITAPQDALAFNPAFDVTPAELITGIITEYGVIKPPYLENIKKLQLKTKEENFNG